MEIPPHGIDRMVSSHSYGSLHLLSERLISSKLAISKYIFDLLTVFNCIIVHAFENIFIYRFIWLKCIHSHYLCDCFVDLSVLVCDQITALCTSMSLCNYALVTH